MDAREVLAALEADPALRAEARRWVLSDELLGLPSLVADNGRQIAALTVRLDRLAEVVEEQGHQIASLMAALDQNVAELGEMRTILGRFMLSTGQVLERLDTTLQDHAWRLGRIEERLR